MSNTGTKNVSVFLRNSSGATELFEGRRLAKLLSELKAGRGGAECAALVDAGYTETLGGLSVDSLDYESLQAEVSGRFA